MNETPFCCNFETILQEVETYEQYYEYELFFRIMIALMIMYCKKFIAETIALFEFNFFKLSIK